MALNYIIGNDGFATLAAPAKGIHVKNWAATISRVNTDISGFGDAARRRRLGLLDMTGSLTGVPLEGETTAVVSPTSTATSALTLGLSSATVSFAINVVYDSYAFSSTKEGDATVTVNFGVADGAVPTVVWYDGS